MRLHRWLTSGDLPFSIECLAESGNIYPVQSPLFLEAVSPQGFAELAAGRAHMHISQYRHSDGALIWGPSPNPDDPVTSCTILVDEDRLDTLCNHARPVGPPPPSTRGTIDWKRLWASLIFLREREELPKPGPDSTAWAETFARNNYGVEGFTEHEQRELRRYLQAARDGATERPKSTDRKGGK